MSVRNGQDEKAGGGSMLKQFVAWPKGGSPVLLLVPVKLTVFVTDVGISTRLTLPWPMRFTGGD